jgi:hypothetical protein
MRNPIPGQLVLVNEPEPRPTWSGYQLTCPIRNPGLTTLQLIAEARRQLDERLEDGDWLLVGEIQYDIRPDVLIVTTTVRDARIPADARPWETPECGVDELLDLYAA